MSINLSGPRSLCLCYCFLIASNKTPLSSDSGLRAMVWFVKLLYYF